MKIDIRYAALLAAMLSCVLSCSQAVQNSSSASTKGKANVTITVSLPASAKSTAGARQLWVSTNVSLRAHCSSDATVTDSVYSLTANATNSAVSSASATQTLSFAAGTWTFTAEAFGNDGSVAYSGSKTVTLVEGSTALAINLFEQSGSIAVTVNLPTISGIEGWVVSALRTNAGPTTIGIAAGASSATLIGVPVGAIDVVVETRDASGKFYQGVASTTVANGQTSAVTVTVSSTPVSPTVVFVPATTTDLQSIFDTNRFKNASCNAPIEFRLAKGSFTMSGSNYWTLPNCFFSGGWADVATRTADTDTTTLSFGSNLTFLCIIRSSIVALDHLSITANGAWQPLRINDNTFAFIDKVSIQSVAAQNPDNASDTGGAKALNVWESFVSASNSTWEGGINANAPNYDGAYQLILSACTLSGGTIGTNNYDVFLNNSKLSYSPADNWDTQSTATSGSNVTLLNAYSGRYLSITNGSVLTINAGKSHIGALASGSAAWDVNAIVASSQAVVDIENSEIDFGFAGAAPVAFLRAFASWDIVTGASYSFKNNALKITTYPVGSSMSSAWAKFIELGTITDGSSSRDSVAIDVEGNSFDGSARPNQDYAAMNFIEEGPYSNEGSNVVNAATVDIFKNNVFHVPAGGSRTNILMNNGSVLDAYASDIATAINDPASTTKGAAGSASGNTVTN